MIFYDQKILIKPKINLFHLNQVGTPGDILKIRLINDFTKSKYKGFFDCFKKILRNEGWIAFSKGLNVNITRAILVNAAELSAYD